MAERLARGELRRSVARTGAIVLVTATAFGAACDNGRVARETNRLDTCAAPVLGSAVGGRLRLLRLDLGDGGPPLIEQGDDVGVADATFSPDGRAIAYTHVETVRRPVGTQPFVSNQSRIVTVRVMHADGSDDRALLTEDDASESRPSWSPDGTEILFHRSDAPVERTGWFVVRADGTRERRVPGSEAFAQAVWGPAGSLAVVRRDGGGATASLQVVDPASGAIEQEFDGTRAGEVAWSPEGSRIAISQAAGGDVDGDGEGEGESTKISVIQLDTGEIQDVPSSTSRSTALLAWSSHGLWFRRNAAGDLDPVLRAATPASEPKVVFRGTEDDPHRFVEDVNPIC